MYNAKTIITSLIVFAFVQETFAKEKDLFLTAGGGISYVTLQDNNFSVMPYTGAPWLASLSLITETPSYIDDLLLFFRYGHMAMDISSGNVDLKTTLTTGNIQYKHVRKLNPGLAANKEFLLGGIFSSSINFYKRSHYGDNYYYYYQSSIGPAFVFRHSLIENGRLLFTGQVDFSVAGYVIYPSYGSNMPENILDKELSGITAWDYILGGKILTLNKFQRIDCTTSLTYGFFKRLSLMLTYNWDFFHLKREDDIIQAIHSTQISIIFH